MQHSVTARLSSAVGIALLLNSLGVTVLAADIDASNSSTGPDSQSVNQISESSKTNVSVNNTANIKNSIKLNLNTGGNTVKSNTDSEGIVTGDIAAGIKIVNEANTNSGITVNDEDADSHISLENHKTGPDSRSSNEVNLSKNNSFSLSNEADIKNKFDIKLNTGDNKIANNSNTGLLHTGDIRVLLDLANKANAKESKKVSEECVDCNKKNEKPSPTPNATPTPEMGKGGVETPGGGIVPAGANLVPFILLGLTFLLMLSRPNNRAKVSL